MVPYAKPGLPLTREILARVTSQTQVILLQNHGLICCGPDVDAVSRLIAEVETRLAMPAAETARAVAADAAPDGFVWSDYGWLAAHHRATELATQGTYYPDHVVFLGPALPQADHAAAPPAILRPDQGVLLRAGATSSQMAMLRCLSDVLARLPDDWRAEPIGPEAEAELLDWDAEKYRQTLDV